MRILCFLLLLTWFIFPVKLLSQTKTELDILYQNARELVNEDANKSIELCLKIKQQSEYIGYKEMLVKSYYLLGFNYYLKGDAENVYKNLNEAIKLAESIRYREGKSLALRLLGTQDAKLGLLEESKRKLDKAIDILKDSNTEEANEIRGMVYNSYLVLMNDNVDVEGKIVVAKKSIREYEKLKNQSRKEVLLVSAYTNLGYLYSKVQKFDSAQWAFRESLKRNSLNDFYLNAAIYHDIAFSQETEGKFDSAVYNYLKALKFCQGKDFVIKRMEILSRLYQIYESKDDEKNYYNYFRQYTSLKDSIDQNKISAVDIVLTESEKKNSKIENQNKFIKYVAITLSALIFCSIIFMIYILINKKKEKKKFDEIIKRLKNEKEQNIQNIYKPEKIQSLSILEETEQRILKCLEEFENGVEFNNSEISLYNLANQINTNTKYLSEVIKKHKNKNFNTYINELRINYIVNILQNDPKYLNYKISHLAAETGFSSHSAFSSIFSQMMGISPSVFIGYLKKESEN